MIQINVNDTQPLIIDKQNEQWLINEMPVDANIQWLENGQVSVLMGHKSYVAQIDKIDKESKEIILKINGQRYSLAIKEEIDLLLDKMGINRSALQKAAPLKAPMPGLILKILVVPGQVVNKGDGLLILEAMKMENVLKATTTATIKSIKVEEKIAVEKGAILIEME